MSRFVSPPISDFDKLRQPLTDGEKLVFEFFDKHLPIEWEIYVQPHLNGLRPDFVLLNPKVGIAVYEVKDWNLNAMDYSVVPSSIGPPKLVATRGGKQFSLQQQNPIEKILRYKEEIYELYCPRLQERAGFGLITAGVIFPYASKTQLHTLFRESMAFRENAYKYTNLHPLVGIEALSLSNISAIFPIASKRIHDARMTHDAYLDMKNWLVEPDSSVTQRQPIHLDQNQLSLVNSRTKSGYRRIKGAAGSGKSLVLAARASELLGQGKEVLVVTFNITLLHYLMDIAVRWPQSSGKTRSDITWVNFHALCKRICQEAGVEHEYKAIFSTVGANEENKAIALSELLPALVERTIDLDTQHHLARYDAILVDEGQDFFPGWWNILRKLCRPDGEMLLVADATQDIYQTASKWTDEAMNGAGFRGAWAELGVSYRLPRAVQLLAERFAKDYLPPETVTLPSLAQHDIGLEPCHLRWVQVPVENAVMTCCDEILRLTTTGSPEQLSFSDLTLLCDSRKTGLAITQQLGYLGVKTVHTFSPEPKAQRRQKIGFYMGDAKVKATTIHSFKGWESRALVLYIGDKVDASSMALFYTALTRLKRHQDGSCLTVVCSAQPLAKFGETWPEYVRA
nr:DNA helicase [Enterovibrio norvegicus]